MQRITNIKFLSMEFDFGYNKEDENTYENKGKVDAEVFVEIENDGEISVVSHKVDLSNLDFLDLMSEEDKVDIISDINTLGDYIQTLRKVIAMKVSSDLGIELADIDFSPKKPLREDVEKLKLEDLNNKEAIAELYIMYYDHGDVRYGN